MRLDFSFPLKSWKLGFMIFVLCLIANTVSTQNSWVWKDPNDLGFIDFGDNKVIVYNFLGLGLVELFDKGAKGDSTVHWSIALANYHEYNREPLSDISIIEGRVGRSLRSYLSWGAGSRISFAYGDGIKTSGIGTYLWFSWHIVKTKKFRLTYDNGVGPNYFIDPFPNGGTRFNFTTHYGLELSTKLNGHWVALQFSNIHISNANIKGMERNPALDAIGIRLGFEF